MQGGGKEGGVQGDGQERAAGGVGSSIQARQFGGKVAFDNVSTFLWPCLYYLHKTNY